MGLAYRFSSLSSWQEARQPAGRPGARESEDQEEVLGIVRDIVLNQFQKTVPDKIPVMNLFKAIKNQRKVRNEHIRIH